MKFQFKSIANNFSRILILLVIFYILFNLGRSIFQNYRVNEKINSIDTDIADLENQNQLLKNQNLYFQTDTYKEIEARKKLGLKSEGETVIIMPDNKDSQDDNSNIISNKSNSKNPEFSPNYTKWYHYVIGK